MRNWRIIKTNWGADIAWRGIMKNLRGNQKRIRRNGLRTRGKDLMIRWNEKRKRRSLMKKRGRAI